MKIYATNLLNFTGKRQDRKTVDQLKNNNPYDLNVINQRNINQAIDNLSQIPGEENVNFLLDVSKKLKYGTNIDLGKVPYNDWQVRLHDAARKSIEISSEKVQPKLYAKLDKITSTKKPLTANELKILDLRKSILEKVDREALDSIKNENIKNFDTNFDYLIASSEIPIAQKVYILKKLDYLMSPKYKINEQLADKKTQVLAEIVNDLVINTPESKIPNIKAINQRQHGMCAAISICRKALAYEDKPHFVDIILSELDNKEYMKVYDISQLGTNEKIPVAKPYINYEYAMQKGYRIIDASALNWMNIADTTGRCNESSENYIAFDKNYFDTFSDLHLFKDINDELAPEQDYYRALFRSKETLEECKKEAVLRDYNQLNMKAKRQEDLKMIQGLTTLLSKNILELDPSISPDKRRQITAGLLALEANDTQTIQKAKTPTKDFMYIASEPKTIKLEKIKKYISANIPDLNAEKLDKFAPELLDLSSDINKLNSGDSTSLAALRINKAKSLYKAAAAYRIQYDFGLENPDRIREMSKVLNLPDKETLILQNIDSLINKLQKGTLNKEVKEALLQRFVLDNKDEAPEETLITALKANRDAFENAMSEILDNLHAACLLENRKSVLLNTLKAAESAIVNQNDKLTLDSISKELNLPIDKRKVLTVINKYIETLENENSTQEQYIEIYNKLGGRNQLADFKASLERLGNIILAEPENYPEIVKGFNVMNNLPEDAPAESTFKAYQQIGNNYNQLVGLITAFQNALEVRNADGEVLNTVVPKTLIMKKLEDAKEIVSEKDLKNFQDKFAKIDNARSNPDGTTILLKDLPNELTEITPYEKAVLKNIEKNINNWYSATTRNLAEHHKEFKEQFDELSREVGVRKGQHWVKEGHSGLVSSAQVKIFEHMTGRPYYFENNSEVAIEKIKNSPYSGISGMSMKSDKMAMHAQYIVDIKPVKVKTADGVQEKESLFHDNSWGPSEQENVWVDENGLIRTDYSMGSGGQLGFITDSNYRSGKLLENLLDDVGEVNAENIDSKKYKKLNRGDDESYKFRMFQDIITPGVFPELRSTIRRIKDNTTIPPDAFFEDLEDIAKGMTRDDLQQKLKNIELLCLDINKTYEDIENRIWGKPPYNKGIETKEDYDKLPSDDNLKLLLEKVAILQSYYDIPDRTSIYTDALTPANLKSLKNIVQKEARTNFDYSFGKTPEIAIAGAKLSANEVHDLLLGYQRDTRVKISDKNVKTIINSLKNIDKDKFNGSLDNTIDLMVESFKNALSTKTLNCENKEQKIDALAENVRAVLKKNMYFNKEDMNSIDFSRDNLPYIEKWIDDNFDPADDNEFVKIYNNMQNMTTAEFKEKYNYLIDDKALGIKPRTGFDVLKDFRALKDGTENAIFNALYFNDMYKNIETGKTVPSYDFAKFNRISKGSTYKNGKRSFDDIFIDYYYSLRTLNLEKIYGRHKETAFQKYGTSPAYAKVTFEDEEGFSQGLMELYTEVTDSIETISTVKKIIATIGEMKKLQKYAGKLDDDSTLKPSQHKYIMNIVMKFHNDYIDDNSLKNERNIADEIILKMNEGKTLGKEYKNLINTLANSMIRFEKTKNGTPISVSIKNELEKIKQQKYSYIMQVVDPKYHKTAFELLNKWIKAKSKSLPDADLYYADFETFLNKHKMIKTPEKMLKDYLLMLAEPTEDNNPYKGLTESQKKELEETKEVYKDNIASLLYSANLVELQEILMSCARKGTLNMIKDELKHTKLQLTNGKVSDLYSDTGILMMLKDMYKEDDLDTALMFIDQLGLGERVIEMYLRSTNFDNAKKCIKRIHSVFQAVDKQTKAINNEVEKLADIDSDPNYMQRLVEAKDRVNKACMNTNFRLTAKNVDKVFTAIIEELKKNPDQPKLELIKYNTDYLKFKNIEFAKNYVGNLNSVLEQIQDIQALVFAIKLPIGSKTEKSRKEFAKKLEDLQNYSKQYAAHFKNIDISTIADN